MFDRREFAMKKTIVIAFLALIGSSVTYSSIASAKSVSSSSQRQTVISVVVESLSPHENAFDIIVAGSSTVYHLENAARLSMAKMRALNNSVESRTPINLSVRGTDVIDILL